MHRVHPPGVVPTVALGHQEVGVPGKLDVGLIVGSRKLDHPHWRESYAKTRWRIGAQRLNSLPVSQERVVPSKEHLRQRQLNPRGVHALQMSKTDVHLGLIERKEIAHPVTKSPRYQCSVVGKPVGAVSVQPTSALKEGKRVVPMEERHPRGNARLKQCVDEAIVKGKTGLIG